MALNFSKIISKVNKFESKVASINSLTKSANSTISSLSQISSTSLGAVSPDMNKIRDAIGADLTKFSSTALPKDFNSLSNNLTGAAFNPGNIDNLIKSSADIGNIAAVSASISKEIQSISNLGSVNVNSALTQGLQSKLGSATNALGTIENVTGSLSRVASEFNTTISSISDKASKFNGFGIPDLTSIVSSFSDFGGLVSNPISVIAKDVSQLVGAVGGEFDRLRQIVETQKSINPLSEFMDLSFKSPWDSVGVAGGGNVVVNSGAAASKIPNPLRNNIGYNYIITLGILKDEEFNFPGIYRNNGDFVQNYILKSAGGNLNKRYQTYLEADDDHAEYYLDNLNLDAVIAPNKNTGVALGTSITFDVIEPYSMGQFIEALIGSAKELGYANYVNAPFCLKIDFVGYDEFGENANAGIVDPIFIPISITKVDFSVTAKGSEYAVQAVPFSETGLDDNVQTSKTQINATGTFVHEVLSGDEKSVTAVFNERNQELEKSETVLQNDRFIIAFPKTPDALVNLIGQLKDQVASENPSLTINAAEQQRRERGLSEAQGDASTARKQSGIDSNAVSAPNLLFNTLKAFASDPENMNQIGLSVLVENSAEGGQESQADQSATYDEFGDVVDISSAEAGKSEKARTTQFRQGEKITNIIEKVVKKSKYCRDNAVEESSNGVRKWFKIDTQVFLDKNPAAESQVGRSPKIYVYSILEYFSDEAKHTGTTQVAKNTEGLKKLAPKEYNYFYTGKNEDVLNFDLTFNNQFFMTAFGNFGQNSGAQATNGGNVVTFQKGDEQAGSQVATEDPRGQNQRNEPGAAMQEVNEMANPGGSSGTDIKLQIAEQFHNTLINQTVDMVTAEMEIWGDPFFLPQQTGNYNGTATKNPNVLEEGTMNYMQGEVFCVVNFKTPFDYQIAGATMEFPQTVPQFSGLFSIWAVTNTFSSGKYVQTLKLIRRRGQDDEPTTSTVAVKPGNSKDSNSKSTAPGTSGSGSAAAANASVNSTIGAADPCNTTSAVANLTASPEELLMSQSLFPATSTTAGDDVVFAQPVTQIGDFAYSPNQSTFPAAPRAETVNAPANTENARSPNGTELNISVEEYNALSGREKFKFRQGTPGTNAYNRMMRVK